MADILISDLDMSECGLSVWDQDKSSCHRLFHPPHTMTLTIANGRNRTPCPWYYGIEFTSREQWFKFVRLVNAMNRRVKKLPRDEHGFPVFEKGGD